MIFQKNIDFLFLFLFDFFVSCWTIIFLSQYSFLCLNLLISISAASLNIPSKVPQFNQSQFFQDCVCVFNFKKVPPNQNT